MFSNDCHTCERLNDENYKLTTENNQLKSNLFKMKDEIGDIDGLIKSYLQLLDEKEKRKNEGTGKNGISSDSVDEIKYLTYELNVTKKKLEQVNDSMNNLQLLNNQLIAENENLNYRLSREYEMNEISKYKKEINEKEKAINKQNNLISKLKEQTSNQNMNITVNNDKEIINSKQISNNTMNNLNLNSNSNCNDLMRCVKEIEYLQEKNMIYKGKYLKFKNKYKALYNVIDLILNSNNKSKSLVNDNSLNILSNIDTLIKFNSKESNINNGLKNEFLNIKRNHDDDVDNENSKNNQNAHVENFGLNENNTNQINCESNFKSSNDDIESININAFLNNHTKNNNESAMSLPYSEGIFNKTTDSKNSINPYLSYKNNNNIIIEKLKQGEDPFVNKENQSYVSKLRSARRRLEESEKEKRIEYYRSINKSSKEMNTVKENENEDQDQDKLQVTQVTSNKSKKIKTNTNIVVGTNNIDTTITKKYEKENKNEKEKEIVPFNISNKETIFNKKSESKEMIYVPPSKSKSRQIKNFDEITNKNEVEIVKFINSFTKHTDKEYKSIELSIFSEGETDYERIEKIYNLINYNINDVIFENFIYFLYFFISLKNSSLVFDYFKGNIIRLLNQSDIERQYLNNNNFLNSNIIKISLHKDLSLILDTTKTTIITHKSILIYSFVFLILIYKSHSDNYFKNKTSSNTSIDFSNYFNLPNTYFSLIKSKSYTNKIVEMFYLVFYMINNNNLNEKFLILSPFKSDFLLKAKPFFSLRRINEIQSSSMIDYIQKVSLLFNNNENNSTYIQNNDKILNFTNDFIRSSLDNLKLYINNSFLKDVKTDNVRINIDLSIPSVIDIYQSMIICLKYIKITSIQDSFIGEIMKYFPQTEDKSILRSIVIYLLSELILIISDMNILLIDSSYNLIIEKLGSWLYSIYNSNDESLKKRFSSVDRIIALVGCMEIYSIEYLKIFDMKEIIEKVNLNNFDCEVIKKIKNKFETK